MNEEIKHICMKCQEHLYCQGKGCAFRSLGNEYCDEVENANKLINDLQKQNTELKEQILLLKASEPMLEFAKQTYKDNWNKLKEWLEESKLKGSETAYLYYGRTLNKMQEIEGGMND